MLSIRYAFCTCAKGILGYLDPSIVFKAKVTHHVRITYNTDCHNIHVIEILLKMTLNPIKPNQICKIACYCI